MKFDDAIATTLEENFKSLEKTQRIFYPRNLQIEEAVFEALKKEYVRLRLENNSSRSSATSKLVKALEYHVVNWEGVVQESLKKKLEQPVVVEKTPPPEQPDIKTP